MFLLSVAGCQGIQKYTLALGSLAISLGITTSLKSEIPFPQNTVSKAKAREVWICGMWTSQRWYAGAAQKCLHQA